jgi:hypothetical protein
MEKDCNDCERVKESYRSEKCMECARSDDKCNFVPIPTTSDLAGFMAGELQRDLQTDMFYPDNDPDGDTIDINEATGYMNVYFAAFCDKHNVSIKIEKRG